MRHGSLFAGIGGFDRGFERAGIETVWTVENDKNCNQVLATHWPDVERYQDVKEVGKRNLAPVDIISGGFPCQDLSVAGRRAGLAGERSGHWFEFARIIEEMEAEWVVVENVPGLFSSNGGADFAVIVRTLELFGYCVAWRVLDSQYFGVPQRRRRVFIIGSLGGTGSIKVLFESEGGEGDIAESREEREGVANGSQESIKDSGVWSVGMDFTKANANQKWWHERTPPLHTGGSVAVSTPFTDKAVCLYSAYGTKWNGNRAAETGELFAYTRNIHGVNKDLAPTLRNGGAGCGSHPMVGVRRLTPTECERLQGFPDGWTEGLSDSARYRCLGNAVTVNVAEWIGRRLIAT